MQRVWRHVKCTHSHVKSLETGCLTLSGEQVLHSILPVPRHLSLLWLFDFRAVCIVLLRELSPEPRSRRQKRLKACLLLACIERVLAQNSSQPSQKAIRVYSISINAIS